MSLDNSKQLLTAKTIDSPWRDFVDYDAKDVMNEDLKWSVSVSDIAEQCVTIINEKYHERQERIKTLKLPFYEGLGLALEHVPLLVLDCDSGLKGVFLDHFLDKHNPAGETPKLLAQMRVKKIVFVACFDKTKLLNLQKLFVRAKWGPNLILSEFEQRFLTSTSQHQILNTRKAQYQVYRYIVYIKETESKLLENLFADQSFPEVLAEAYKKLDTEKPQAVVKQVVNLMIGPPAKRNTWSEELAETLALAGDEFSCALYKTILEFLAEKYKVMLAPIAQDEPGEIEDIALFEEFARSVLPETKHKAFESNSSLSKRLPVIFEQIHPTQDALEGGVDAIESLTALALLIEDAVFKIPAEHASWLNKYKKSDIASAIIARFLTIFHQRVAVYQYEDVHYATGIKSILVYFEDGFTKLAKDLLFTTKGITAPSVDELKNITLYDICRYVSYVTHDAEFTARASAFSEKPFGAKLLQMHLWQPPTTADGVMCSILNIASQEITAKDDVMSQIGDVDCWVFANLPFEDAQLHVLLDQLITDPRLPPTVAFCAPDALTPIEDERRRLLIELLVHGRYPVKREFNYRTLLVGNTPSQQQMLNFDKLQRKQNSWPAAPQLKNCIVTEDGEHVIQRFSLSTKPVAAVVDQLGELMGKTLDNIHQMMISNTQAYYEAVRQYRDIEKNPEAEFFEELPSEQLRSLYVYYKQLQQAEIAQNAQGSFKHIISFLEYLLKGYLSVPFYVLRCAGDSVISASHLFRMPDQCVSMDIFKNTQQMLLILNKNLPPVDSLGYEAVQVIDAIVSGEHTSDDNYVQKENIVKAIKLANERKGITLLRGEFLIACDGLGVSAHTLPTRELSREDMIKVVTVSELEQHLSPFFGLLPKVNDGVLVLPISKVRNYNIVTAI